MPRTQGSSSFTDADGLLQRGARQARSDRDSVLLYSDEPFELLNPKDHLCLSRRAVKFELAVVPADRARDDVALEFV